MRGEKGFTMIELIIVITIAASLAGIVPTAFHQVLMVPEYGNDRLTALHELQNVGFWLNLDGQMAQSASGGGSLVLTNPNGSTTNYTLAGNDLVRTTSTSNRTLAWNISSVNFTVQVPYVTMNITASPTSRWDVSENKIYEICLRPVGG